MGTRAKINNFGEGFESVEPRLKFYDNGAITQNFGDYLPPLLAKHLFQGPRVQADIYFLIGSVIYAPWILKDLRHTIGAEKGLIIYWGCGMREAVPLPEDVRRHCKFYGVRGPLTRDQLGLPPETPLGDPGLLLPLFITPKPGGRTAGKTVCIPHAHDRGARDELLKLSGCDIAIDPVVQSTETDLLRVIEEIANADFVLTGSLHGAIVACAFERPFAFWNTGFIDAQFKWEDFALSVGIEAEFVKTLDEGQRLYAKQRASLKKPSLSAILRAAPFAPKLEAIARAMQHDGRLPANSDLVSLFRAEDSLLEPLIEDNTTVTASTIKAWSSLSTQSQIRAGRCLEAMKNVIKRVRNLYRDKRQ